MGFMGREKRPPDELPDGGRRRNKEQTSRLGPPSFLSPGTGDLIHEQMSSFMYPVVWSHELPNVVAAIVPSHATSS